jgi:hypothetical protein
VLKAFSSKSYTEGLGCGAIELAGQAKDFRGRELMGELHSRRGCRDGLAAYVAGFALATCVDKNHGIGVADGFCYLWQELSQLENLYFG